MARTRQIKPGFFVNEDMVELPFQTRLLFIGLLTIADRRGILEDRPKKIKMAIFPADNVDVEQCLSELASADFINRYEVGDGKYIHIIEFVKHQNPHKDEKASDLPDPIYMQAVDKHGASTVQARCKHGADSVPAQLVPSNLYPNTCNKNILSSSAPEPDLVGSNLRTDSGRVVEAKDCTPPAHVEQIDSLGERAATGKPEKQDVSEDIFNYWKQVMGHERAMQSAPRTKAIKVALKAGYQPDDLKTAILGCSKTPHNMGANDRGERYDDLHICLKLENIDRFIRNAQKSPVTQANNNVPNANRKLKVI
jgi:hypothetical protein